MHNRVKENSSAATTHVYSVDVTDGLCESNTFNAHELVKNA